MTQLTASSTRRRTPITTRITRTVLAAAMSALLFAATTTTTTCDAFQLSMVASRVPFGGFDPSPPSSSPRPPLRRQQPGGGVSSGLISQLAVMALKSRLREQADVSCDVTASTSDLLFRGAVGPVSVRGKGWASRLGLTCRAIDATVDACELDVGKVVALRKLRLTRAAEGRAMIAFNAEDFGNFITHPLMRPPALPESSSDDDALAFSKEGTEIDAKTGAVVFFGTHGDARWKFSLRRSQDAASTGGNALIVAERADGGDDAGTAARLTSVVSRFFNEMVFELDGTFLSFQDMMVTNKGKEPCVMLKLNILVRKFPSPGLEF